MMRALTTLDLVDIWEQGGVCGYAQRALLLLSRIHPDISDDELEAMPLGVRDGLLLQLRHQLFGSRLESVVRCPRCGESLEIRVDAHQLIASRESSDASTREWTTGDLSVRFRVPTAGDLRDLEKYSDPGDVRRSLLERCVVEARRGGERIEPLQLTGEESIALGERIAQADPHGELLLNSHCPGCGHSWDSVLDIASFLWQELDTHVRRLVAEVHTLASAYAWSERDILTMSARRRQMYLEELQAR
jgi:hypothetical protein